MSHLFQWFPCLLLLFVQPGAASFQSWPPVQASPALMESWGRVQKLNLHSAASLTEDVKRVRYGIDQADSMDWRQLMVFQRQTENGGQWSQRSLEEASTELSIEEMTELLLHYSTLTEGGSQQIF